MATPATERPVSSHVLVQDVLTLIDNYMEDARAGNLPNSAEVRSSFKALREQSERVRLAGSAYSIGDVMDRASSALIDIIATYEMAKISGSSLVDASDEALQHRRLLEGWCARNWR